MKNLITFVLILSSLLLCFSAAEAKRFGGGRSVGVFRPHQSFQQPASAANAAKAASPQRSFLGPVLGGLLVGGLAYLLLQNGIGSGIMIWLLIASVGFMLWRRYQQSLQPAPQFATGVGATQTTAQNFQYSAAPARPAFNEALFIDSAKELFRHLQVANDKADLNVIREFTTPPLFEMIRSEISERENLMTHTEVVSLEADIKDVTDDTDKLIISVLFTGTLIEDAVETHIRELWHFYKMTQENRCVIAGIQQI